MTISNDVLERISAEASSLNPERAQLLFSSASKAVLHFVQRPYGDEGLSNPDNVTNAWPFVRATIFDIFRPQMDGVPSQFANVRWSDKLLQDASDEAHAISKEILPPDISRKDWRFLSFVFPNIFMHENDLVQGGYVTPTAIQNLTQVEMEAGVYSTEHDGADKYCDMLETWASMPEYNIGNRIENSQ